MFVLHMGSDLISNNTFVTGKTDCQYAGHKTFITVTEVSNHSFDQVHYRQSRLILSTMYCRVATASDKDIFEALCKV